MGDVNDGIHVKRSQSCFDESRKLYDSILIYGFGKSCGAYLITRYRAPGRNLSTIADYYITEPNILSPWYHSQASLHSFGPLAKMSMADTMPVMYIENLRQQIYSFELLLLDLKQRLAAAEQDMGSPEPTPVIQLETSCTTPPVINPPTLRFEKSATQSTWKWPLEAQEYMRYGRQMIMPEVRLQGRRARSMNNVEILIRSLQGNST